MWNKAKRPADEPTVANAAIIDDVPADEDLVAIDPVLDDELENEEVVKFRAPYEFEGTVYRELDLSGVADLSTRDLTSAEKLFTKRGGSAMMPELNIGFCAIVASKATRLPLEFFDGLPARDMLAIKNHLVASFFSSGD